MTTATRQIQKLRRYQKSGFRDLEKMVVSARRDVRNSVIDAAEAGKIATAKGREGIYASIAGRYSELSRDMGEWAKTITGEISKDWRQFAIDAVMAQTGGAVKTRFTRFSPEYTNRIFELVAPQGGKRFAGVFTDKMTEVQLRQLRESTAEAFRLGSIEGWDSNRIQKEIQERWQKTALTSSTRQFVDAAGRRWDNANYLRMLTRTTTARVARESYLSTLSENGDDLIRVRAVGDSCKYCVAWDGVILSISGKNSRFPSYNTAVNSKGHLYGPNCDCLQERVDMTLNDEEIKAQRDTAQPDWDDPEKIHAFKDKASKKGPVNGPIVRPKDKDRKP